MHRLTRLCLAYPKASLALIGVATAVLAAGLPRVEPEFGYRVLLGDDHPTIRTLDHFIEQFGGGLPITIVWECGAGHPCASVFDAPSLEMADTLRLAIEPVSGVRNVYGISNAPLLVPDPGGFSIRRFDEVGASADFAQLAERALADPLWDGVLVASGGRVGAIHVQTVDNDAGTLLRVFEDVERALRPFEARGFDFRLAGEAATTIPPGRDLAQSSSRLVPVAVLVIAVVLFSMSRSWRQAAIALGTMGIALVWTLGVLGWSGWPRDAILEVLAPLILIVGVCDAIHLLSTYGQHLGAADADSREARERALLAAAEAVSVPCLVTTLTTAVALLSFLTSPLDTFLRFGTISAVGVGACLLLTFTLLPLLAHWIRLEPGVPSLNRAWATALSGVVRASRRRPREILVATSLLLVMGGIGWTKLRVDTDWLESLGDRSIRVQWTRFVEKYLRPSETVELELGLPKGSRVEDPAALQRIVDFSSSVEGGDRFGEARSIVDLIERANRLVHEDDPRYERIGRSEAENGELLELLRLNGSELSERWLSLDRSRLRVSIEVPEQPSSQRREGLEELRELISTHIPAAWGVRMSGKYIAQLEWMRDVQTTQLRSFPTAFLLVLVLVGLFLRSWRMGLAAMVPTLLPVLVVLGTMGWMGMSLDIGRAMIAAVVIGVAVDDSIHLLHSCGRHRAAGCDRVEAMQRAILEVGRAVISTSLALALGFLTLMASAWQTIASFGFLVSLAILGALVASLFVLPALVVTFSGEDG